MCELGRSAAAGSDEARDAASPEAAPSTKRKREAWAPPGAVAAKRLRVTVAVATEGGDSAWAAQHATTLEAALSRAVDAAAAAEADSPIGNVVQYLLEHVLATSDHPPTRAKALAMLRAAKDPAAGAPEGRASTAEAATAAAAAGQAEAEARVEEEQRDGKCTFYFIGTTYLKSVDRLPAFHDVEPGALVERTVVATDAYRGAHAGDGTLVVSHRWEAPDEPDGTGTQLRALQAHLEAHPHISQVWIDYACMCAARPRAARRPAAAAARRRSAPCHTHLALRTRASWRPPCTLGASLAGRRASGARRPRACCSSTCCAT